MIPVRHARVPASRPVRVRRIVRLAAVRRRTSITVRTADRDGVLVDVIAVHMVQVAVMQVVGVALVEDGRVPAARAVNVRVALVCMVHRCRLLSARSGAPLARGRS
jgi:hypothetical protein